MEKITNELKKLKISNNRESIYQINGINYSKKDFYEKIKSNIKDK